MEYVSCSGHVSDCHARNRKNQDQVDFRVSASANPPINAGCVRRLANAANASLI